MGKMVATDISAGFNLVSKEILIPKMEKFGFGEMSCKLLENYLTRRRTQVKIKNVKSGEIVLETGVGEGSVLGRNFFSCGMADMSVVAKRSCRPLRTLTTSRSTSRRLSMPMTAQGSWPLTRGMNSKLLQMSSSKVSANSILQMV